MKTSHELKGRILNSQQNEITEHIIYKKLAEQATGNNKRILEKISSEEMEHYKFFKKFTSQDVRHDSFKVVFYYLVSRFLGINFGLRLMEREERLAQDFYDKLAKIEPGVKKIVREEERHEESLLRLLDRKELAYTGSVVLGLNDALVELTGALAGFTLALKETRIIAVAGLISGIAASLSMAGSEYLSAEEEGRKRPIKASLYTGIAYIIAVFLLILPYFLFENSLVSLAITAAIAISVIIMFSFYISVAKSISFKKRFFKMAALSLGVAVLSFFIGLLARKLLNIEI